MSLNGIARQRANEEDQRAEKAPPSKPSDVTDQVVSMIPAEALGLFVAGMGFFEGTALIARWILFAVVLAATPCWVYIRFRNAAHNDEARRKLPLAEMMLASTAFVLWSTSVPGTPFLVIPGFSVRMGAGIVLVGGGVLAVLANIFAAKRRDPAS